jgi:centromere protein V
MAEGDHHHPSGAPAATGTISRGGCHCGRIAYEVAGRPARVTQCNCSICAKKGYLHWIVPRSDFRLLTPIADLATYTFNTHVARHHFCPRCGVAPFYIARSDPDKIDVNARCLDGIDLAALAIEPFDGRNWEAAHAASITRRRDA